jgi:hypothetical protein
MTEDHPLDLKGVLDWIFFYRIHLFLFLFYISATVDNLRWLTKKPRGWIARGSVDLVGSWYQQTDAILPWTKRTPDAALCEAQVIMLNLLFMLVIL